MSWLLLLIAGGLEVFWAIEMKLSEGFTILGPTILTAVGYILSAVVLSFAIKELPLGTAYAIWTGIGIIGTSILGILSLVRSYQFHNIYVFY